MRFLKGFLPRDQYTPNKYLGPEAMGCSTAISAAKTCRVPRS